MNLSNPNSRYHYKYQSACNRWLFMYLVFLWPVVLDQLIEVPSVWILLVASVDILVFTGAVIVVVYVLVFDILPAMWEWLKGD